jgi:hypothetical protein
MLERLSISVLAALALVAGCHASPSREAGAARRGGAASPGAVARIGPAPRKKVAVYVYAGLDEEELAPFARNALRELEQVGSTPELDVVVELDDYRPGIDARYHLAPQAREAEAPAVFRTPPVAVLSEVDSGQRSTLESFLTWAVERYPAERAFVVLLGHSWGWRGVIQDFDLPQQPLGTNSMIPVYDLRAALEKAVALRGAPFDAVILDACITGVVEVAYELDGVAYALLASELETPLSSLPYARVLALLAAHAPPTDEVLAFWVRDAVVAYARGGRHARRHAVGHRPQPPELAGRMAAMERQFFPVTAVAVRLGRMAAFRAAFDELLAALEAARFHDDVLVGSEFLADFVDRDFNADVYDFLLRVERYYGTRAPELVAKSRAVRALFAYPDDGSTRAMRAERIPVRAGQALRVDLEADEMVEPERTLCYALSAFEFMNKGYSAHSRDCDAKPGELAWDGVYLAQPLLVERSGRPYLRLALDTAAADGALELRVRMPGAERFFYAVGGGDWTAVELGADYEVFDRFPASSLLIAEGHSNAAYNIHGLGIFARTKIDPAVPRAYDPATRTIRDERYYDLLRWSRESRWSMLLFGDRLRAARQPVAP